MANNALHLTPPSPVPVRHRLAVQAVSPVILAVRSPRLTRSSYVKAEVEDDMGKKLETKIPGVFAPATGPERYRVILSKFCHGTTIVPFVYLTTDDLEEAIAEASQHPDKNVFDTRTEQIVSLPEPSSA